MKKKIVLILFILSISFIVLVSAIQMEKEIPGYGTISGEYVEAPVKFSDGWNLIHGLPNPDWLSGRLEPENVKAIYGLHPITKEYIRFYPENPELKNLDISIDYFIGTTAFWVYIDYGETLPGETEYYTLEPTPLENKQLFTGWNLIGITPYMYDQYPMGTFTFNSIKGNCVYEKLYLYFPQENPPIWGDFMDKLDSPLDDDFIMQGFAVKVSEDCNLGLTNEGITSTPPQLP